MVGDDPILGYGRIDEADLELRRQETWRRIRPNAIIPSNMPPSRNQVRVAANLLRVRAEEQLRDEAEILTSMSPEQMQATIHDLHVHQIELEMQNEQLRFTQAELEAARERYVELYDFAPVGYLTVSREGIILQANLTSVSMLAVERSQLLSAPFSRYVFTADQEAYYHCWRKVFDSGLKQAYEIRLRPGTGAIFCARLEAIQAIEGDKTVCLLTLSDISEQKRAEESLRESERKRVQYENDEWKRLALEAGELGAWDQDLWTGRISCSVHACAMLGFPPDTVVNWETFLSRIHSSDCPVFLQEIEKSTNPRGNRRCDTVFRIAVPDGAVRWVRFVARTFFEAGNRNL